MSSWIDGPVRWADVKRRLVPGLRIDLDGESGLAASAWHAS